MVREKATLSWRTLGDAGGHASLVQIRGTRRQQRPIVSALAAEIAGSKGTTLWVGAEEVARPLAWLPIREQRLDARPLRPELGEEPWPGVNPFDLDSNLLADWLRIEIEALRPWPAARVREHIERARTNDIVAHLHPTARTFSAGVNWARAAGLPIPAFFDGTGRPIAVRERTDISFPSGSLTVVCGHRLDLADRVREILLVLLAFISASRTVSGPNDDRLIVLDGVWPLFSVDQKELLANALQSFVGRGEGCALIAEHQSVDVPAVPAWESTLLEIRPHETSKDECWARMPGGREFALYVPTPQGLERA